MTTKRESAHAGFNPTCGDCPRLARYLAQIRRAHPDYYARPVASFGAPNANFLIVGLAPGMQGANRTGRPFTGDYAGNFLFRTLHQLGFANKPEATNVNDGLRLVACRITNAVKCLPPHNKPTQSEILCCNKYLHYELKVLSEGSVILALGTIAHQAVLRALGLKHADWAFSHGAAHSLPNGLTLYDSYHCSRYNIQTRRLTPQMFQAVLISISRQLATQKESSCRI